MDVGADRNTVYLLSSDPHHAALLRDSLAAEYIIRQFDNESHALDELSTHNPTMIVVHEGLRPNGGLKAVERIRHHKQNKFTPILFAGNSKDRFAAYNAVARGASEYVCLFDHNNSLKEITHRLVNETIEQTWEQLPEEPRKALQQTAKCFKAVTEQIVHGHQIAVKEVEESCMPLVKAIETSQIAAIMDGIRNYDDYTYVHSMRVATLLALFGYGIGVKGHDLVTLAAGGLLHDVGKIKISTDVLNKPGRLNDMEWGIIRGHVNNSLDILTHSEEVTRGILVISGQHHEKLDGSGYPNGLKGGQVNELARMAAIADIYGALSDRRTYKPAIEPDKVFPILESMTSELDQHLVELFKGFILDL